MAGGTRHTFKQELIKDITYMMRRSSLDPLPESCLRDMSTSSLAAFKEWLEPIIKDNPQVTTVSHQLPAPKEEVRSMSQVPTLDEVEQKLRSHDWNYQYSDDHGVYCRGDRSWDELVAMIRQLPKEVKEQVRPLWEEHASRDYEGRFDDIFSV